MSRELYDLCRRYKHYYKKVRDVKSLDDKYHDLDLSGAFSVAQWQLCETEDEILKQLFKEFGVVCDRIESHNEIVEPCYSRRMDFLAPPRVVGTISDVKLYDSGRFLKCLSEYICDRNRK